MQKRIVTLAFLLSATFVFSPVTAARSAKHPSSESAELTSRKLPALCQWNPAEKSPQDRGLAFNVRILELCRLENNSEAVRSVLRVIGIIHQNEGRSEDAKKTYLEGLGMSTTTRQRIEMLDSLGSLCLDHEAVGNPAQATQCREENLLITEATGDKRVFARALRDFGDYYRSKRDSATAMKYYDREMQVYEGLDDKVGIGSTLRNIGFMYHTQSNISLAMDYYRSSVVVAEQLGDKGELGDAVGSVCVLHRSSGYNQKAIDCLLNEALPLYMAVNDKAEVAGIYINVARAYQALRDYPHALAYYERSIKLRDEAGLYWKVAETLGFAVGVHYQNKDFVAVRDTYARSIEALKKEPTTRANVRRLISALYNFGLDRGGIISDADRLDYLHKSLQLCEKYGERGLHVQTLRQISQFYSGRGSHRQSLKYSRQADNLETSQNLSTTWISSLTAAQAHVAKNEREKALPNFEETLNRIENAAESQIKIGTYFESLLSRYTSEYVETLMTLHRQQPSRDFDRKAFEVNERSKARFFRRDLDESAVDLTRGVDSALLERERMLRLELNAKEEYLAREPKADVAAVKLQISQITSGLQTVSSQIRKASPQNRALTPTSPLDVSAVQRELVDDDTALVEYSLGEVSCFWVLTRSSFKSYFLRTGRSVDINARRLHALLSDQKNWNEKASAEYQQLTARLARELIAPAYETLKGKKLVIVADGALHYIPFGVLPVPDQKTENGAGQVRLLAEDHEIVSLPSASVVSVLRRQRADRKPAPKQVVLFADPVFEPDDERIAGTVSKARNVGTKINDVYGGSRTLIDEMLNRDGDSETTAKIPRLPFSRREADAIYETASKEESLMAVDFDASFENAMSDRMSQYRIIHFATHGVLHSEYPELSGIVLSLYDRGGLPIKGFLRLNEIYKMRLNADLVVLSACQTALGKEIRGEGLVGLTRGFMYAGSPSVIASLWKVDDVATAELMKIFYQKMLKENMRPAAALRAAKVEMIRSKRWNAPYYWAAFELQGEWR